MPYQRKKNGEIKFTKRQRVCDVTHPLNPQKLGDSVFAHLVRCSKRTLEDRADLLEDGEAACAEVLTEAKLEQQQWHSDEKYHHYVRDEERTCNSTSRDSMTSHSAYDSPANKAFVDSKLRPRCETHDEHLMVFIAEQNLVGISAVKCCILLPLRNTHNALYVGLLCENMM